MIIKSISLSVSTAWILNDKIAFLVNQKMKHITVGILAILNRIAFLLISFVFLNLKLKLK